jgi:hypothetical protein
MSPRAPARSAALVVSEAAVSSTWARLYEKFGIHSGLDRRRMRLANEALRRGAVNLAEVRASFRRRSDLMVCGVAKPD